MGINLDDVIPVGRKVPNGSGVDIVVKGLSLSQITVLVRDHKDSLLAFVKGAGDGSAKDLDFESIVSSAPEMVAVAICMATDSEGQEEKAKKIPIWLQIDLVVAIWEESVPDLKKLVGLLSGVTTKLKESSKPES